MTSTQPAPVVGRLGAAGVAVTVAAALTNGLAYLVPVVAARHLAPAELSALAGALGLISIASVPGLGLQLALAVHRARHGPADVRRTAWVTAALCAGALLVATPLLAASLRLPAEVPALLAVTTASIVLSSRWLGELQGDQRFLRLAVGIAVLGVGRYAGIVVGLLLDGGLTGSLAAGALIAALTPTMLARLASSRPPAAPLPGRPKLTASRVLTGCGATLAMLVVSYADVLLARQLPSAESGAYAVGSVLTKGALWAPQVVTVLALPRLARGDQRTRTVALVVTAGCGVLLVLASALAGGLAFRLAGGPAYAHHGRYAPIFAAVGALYALAFVLLNARVAAGHRWPAAPLWCAAVGLVVTVLLIAPRTLTGLLWSALVTAAAAVVAMALATLRRRGEPDVAPSTEPDRPPGPAPSAAPAASD